MKYALILLGLAGVLVLMLAFQRPISVVPPLPQTASASSVTVGTSTILVEVADTNEKRTRGLSGRQSLSENHGMLFIFDYENNWGIWMKDMRFPIDIIWADSRGKIITIARNVSPGTFPNAFYPAAPARYVLELPAGETATRGIVEEMHIEF